MLKKLFYFIIIFIHFHCFSTEEQIDLNQKVQNVPVRLTIFSPYTNLDLFSSEEASMQKNNILFGLFYGESDYLYGFGMSSFILNTSHDMYGVQFSLINRIGGDGKGVQFGVTNYSHEFHGFQFGVVNRTNNVAGFQLGIVNTADDIEGIQIGIVNIAKNVSGSQLGFINIADDQEGYSFGILSFLLKTGQAKLSLWYDTEVPFNIGLKAGRKYFYGLVELNVIKAAYTSSEDLLKFSLYPPVFSNSFINGASYSVGIGSQITIEPVWVEFEIKWHNLTDNNGKSINSLRLQYSTLVGTTFGKIYDYFGVVSLNSPGISGSGAPDIFNFEKYLPDHNYSISFGLGAQFLIAGVFNW